MMTQEKLDEIHEKLTPDFTIDQLIWLDALFKANLKTYGIFAYARTMDEFEKLLDKAEAKEGIR